jgi:N4-gp56 family major capsid protein
MAWEKPISYNDPLGGQESSVGSQLRTDYYKRKALIELVKEKYFTPFADTTVMPKHAGKKIRHYHWVPLLDDANINDQGIDANGVTTTREVTITVATPPNLQGLRSKEYIPGEGATAAAALAAAQSKAEDYFKELGVFDTDYATTKANLEGLPEPWVIDDTGVDVPASGNLYGSSKDVGYIAQRLPVIGEHGGRVNRVGYTRITLEGTFENLGFFSEYTKDSLNFDTESGLLSHINREMLRGANEMTEDALQIDLLNNAGIIVYGGTATATSEINGDAGTESLVTYMDLANLTTDLDDNRTPMKTTIIKGSRMIDTRVISGARPLLIGSALKNTVRAMTDMHGNPAFIDVKHYADAGTLMNGEIGAVDQFRIIVVPEMMHWEGAGAAVTNNAGYRESNGHYNVYPMLSIGEGSFTTIGFETSSGKMTKFNIIHKKPGRSTADRHDPFGKTGFMSIQWWYGFMVLHPERIALIKTVAAY